MLNHMFTIGQLAKQTGVTIRTIRYYDKIGLLTPTDYKEGGHRLYSFDDLSRLQQIQSLKFIGFSLKDIADLLKLQRVEHKELSESITFKKRELLAEQMRIQQTIDQLEHMNCIISDHDQLDLKLFCFILHSILWEEENLDESIQSDCSIHNFRNKERVRLDKEYFSLLMELKQLAANNADPESEEAFTFMKKFVSLYKQMLSKIDKNDLQTESHNILNPFTKEEQLFLKNAFSYVSKLENNK